MHQECVHTTRDRVFSSFLFLDSNNPVPSITWGGYHGGLVGEHVPKHLIDLPTSKKRRDRLHFGPSAEKAR